MELSSEYWWNVSLIASEIPSVRFFLLFRPKCLLMFYSVYCKTCDLRGLENSNLLRCTNVLELALKCCSDINERSWIQVLFSILVMVNSIALLVGIKLFHLWVKFPFEVSSYCCLTEKLNWDSKTKVIEHRLIFRFSGWKATFGQLHICME